MVKRNIPISRIGVKGRIPPLVNKNGTAIGRISHLHIRKRNIPGIGKSQGIQTAEAYTPMIQPPEFDISYIVERNNISFPIPSATGSGRGAIGNADHVHIIRNEAQIAQILKSNLRSDKLLPAFPWPHDKNKRFGSGTVLSGIKPGAVKAERRSFRAGKMRTIAGENALPVSGAPLVRIIIVKRKRTFIKDAIPPGQMIRHFLRQEYFHIIVSICS